MSENAGGLTPADVAKINQIIKSVPIKGKKALSLKDKAYPETAGGPAVYSIEVPLYNDARAVGGALQHAGYKVGVSRGGGSNWVRVVAKA